LDELVGGGFQIILTDLCSRKQGGMVMTWCLCEKFFRSAGPQQRSGEAGWAYEPTRTRREAKSARRFRDALEKEKHAQILAETSLVLHGDGLARFARLVDVAAAADGDVIGEANWRREISAVH